VRMCSRRFWIRSFGLVAKLSVFPVIAGLCLVHFGGTEIKAEDTGDQIGCVELPALIDSLAERDPAAKTDLSETGRKILLRKARLRALFAVETVAHNNGYGVVFLTRKEGLPDLTSLASEEARLARSPAAVAERGPPAPGNNLIVTAR
jgi:hypothetical protein